MLLGVHVSIAKGIYEAVPRAEALGCTAMQIFLHDPRQWRKHLLKTEDIKEFRSRRASSGIAKFFIHASYLINLASPSKFLYNRSAKALIADCREAWALGAAGLVVHPGSHTGSGESRGLRRVTSALNRIIEATQGSPVPILLENTSGAGSWLCSRFAQMKHVLRNVETKSRVGVCFDTCHAYAAGYNLRTPNGLSWTLKDIVSQIGIDAIKVIHLNDCAGKLGGHVDVHAHIGKGRIGTAGFRRLINEPAVRNIPLVMETPKDSDTADLLNLRKVRGLAQKEPSSGR